MTTLAAPGQQDKIGLVTDILPAFQHNRRAIFSADGGAEPVRPGVLRRKHFARRLGGEKRRLSPRQARPT